MSPTEPVPTSSSQPGGPTESCVATKCALRRSRGYTAESISSEGKQGATSFWFAPFSIESPGVLIPARVPRSTEQKAHAVVFFETNQVFLRPHFARILSSDEATKMERTSIAGNTSDADAESSGDGLAASSPWEIATGRKNGTIRAPAIRPHLPRKLLRGPFTGGVESRPTGPLRCRNSLTRSCGHPVVPSSTSTFVSGNDLAQSLNGLVQLPKLSLNAHSFVLQPPKHCR